MPQKKEFFLKYMKEKTDCHGNCHILRHEEIQERLQEGGILGKRGNTQGSAERWYLGRGRKRETENDIYKASMLGCVHADLCGAKKIGERSTPVEGNYQNPPTTTQRSTSLDED